MVAVGDLLQVDKTRNAGKVAPRRDLMSLAFIVSDSLDPSARAVRNSVTALKGAYRRATVLQRDFGYQQVGDIPSCVSNLVAEQKCNTVAALYGAYRRASVLQRDFVRSECCSTVRPAQ